MNYKNSVCDGCGIAFSEADDVVVCPECGTPQHRECYLRQKRCVNHDKHVDGFEWKAELSPSAPSDFVPSPVQEAQKLPCPSCGHLNDKDARVCENCSMKLFFMGMNLARAANEASPDKPEKEDSNTEGYPPPFTLGQGAGFEHHSTELTPPPQQTPPAAPQYPAQNYGQPTSYPPQGQYPAQGYPQQNYGQYSETDFARENARQFILNRFLGSNAGKFISKFAKISDGKGFTFNWAAFFFGPYWFFYRKLYQAGAIFLTVSLLISTVFTPIIEKFASIVSVYEAYGEELYTNETLLNSFMQDISRYYPIVVAYAVANIAVSAVAGLIAYPLYKKYTEKSLGRIMSAPTSDEGMRLTAKLGGTSALAVFACYLITLIMTYITDFIMYSM